MGFLEVVEGDHSAKRLRGPPVWRRRRQVRAERNGGLDSSIVACLLANSSQLRIVVQSPLLVKLFASWACAAGGEAAAQDGGRWGEPDRSILGCARL